MAISSTLVDRVKIFAESSGSGPFVLGNAVPAFRGAEALIDGLTYSYAVESGADYEAGQGVYVEAVNQLIRAPSISSANGAPVPFPANVSINFTALAADLLTRLEGSGTVTSVSGSGGTTGLTLTGGPIEIAGVLTLGGVLNVANGGTGGTDGPSARTGIGLGNVDNTSDANKPVSTLQQIALNAKASLTDLAATTGGSLIGFQQIGTGATADTLRGRELQAPLSPFDFMTAAERTDVRNRTKTLDVTAAVNACFLAAQIAQRTVELPDGAYLVGNLLFGSQSTSLTQSASPLGLYGASKHGATFVAKPGLTGTLLQGWSLAGITLRDFSVETIGTAATAMDLEWKPFTGPSTQNIIENIIVSGGSAALHVNLKNLNDTIPYRLMVRVNDNTGASCGIDFTASGGLQVMRDCIWSGCFLRWGCQNGVIDGCWGFGIEFSSGCLNYTAIIGGYLYANLDNNAVLWSEAFTAQQSARAVVCTATQFITANPDAADMGWNPVTAYVNMNLYSALIFDGCQFIGEPGEADINLLGANCRRDSFANVQLMFRGGSQDNLILNDRTGLEYADPEAFMNDVTGQRVTKSLVTDGTVGLTGIAAATTNDLQVYRRRNRIYFDARVAWTGQTPSAPLQFTLPIGSVGNDAAVTIGYNGDSFAGSPLPAAFLAAGTNIIVFSNAVNGADLTAKAAGQLIISGNFLANA